MPDNSAPFQMRGSTFTMMVLRLIDPEHPSFFPLLGNKVRQAPNFFRFAPVVLDLDDFPPERTQFDFAGFVRRLREQRLIPVGVQGGTPELQALALAAGLPLIPGRPVKGDKSDEPVQILAQPSAQVQAMPPRVGMAAPQPVVQRTTLVITEPVRSGRQIYAHQGDLVVTAPVSAGAELLADGHIHVYGALRGRALAGIGGDTTARIFCQSLDAELVSIAGLYRVNEDIDPAVHKKPVQIYLSQGYLHMDALA